MIIKLSAIPYIVTDFEFEVKSFNLNCLSRYICFLVQTN